MIVKKNILLLLLLLGNSQIVLSLFLKKATLGYFWYYVNANSLVGVQSYIESNLNNFYDFFYISLNSNIFIISGLLFILIGTFITDLLA